MLVTQLLNCKKITDTFMTMQADFFMEDLLVEPSFPSFQP